MTRRAQLAAVLAGALALAACGGTQSRPSSAPASPSARPTTTATTPSPTRPPPRAAAGAAASRTPTAGASARPTQKAPLRAATLPSPKPVAAPAAPTCRVPAGVTATQVVLVTSSGSSATVRACRRTGGHYLRELGPYDGHVGRNGVSWSKREGDLRTPAGTYPLRGGFGVRADPGLRLGWFTVGSADVWVDDSGSRLYNTHQRAPADGRWASAEDLLKIPAYDYAQVIGYNEARTPGRGSAIFFHVDLGHGTAGCVSLSTSALLSVFRWERAGAVMSIS